jgi:hypothetical protein
MGESCTYAYGRKHAAMPMCTYAYVRVICLCLWASYVPIPMGKFMRLLLWVIYATMPMCELFAYVYG